MTGPTPPGQEALDQWLADAAEHGVSAEPGTRAGETVVVLPGERKLRTTVSVLLSGNGLRAMAFVVRNPDENHPVVYRWLLEKNLRTHLASFALGANGDVYLHAHLPPAAVDAETLDQLFGELLSLADGSFNELLALGFLTSMKREWAWRVSRGESTRNLEAFAHLLDPARDESKDHRAPS